jgi:hypothetical protein
MKSKQKAPPVPRAAERLASPETSDREVPDNVKALIEVLVELALEEHRKRILGRLAAAAGGGIPADGQQPK